MENIWENQISVIIPAYNAERFVGDCLDSVIAQTYNNLDIVVVDDGSNDMTGSIVDEYAKRDTRIQVIHQKNAGLSRARNVGLKYARGKYIMFLDSDDWLEPTCCEIALGELQIESADLVIFEYYKEYKNKTVQMQTYSQKKLLYDIKEQKEFFLYDMRTITAWGKIYSAGVLENCEFNENLETAEDVEFNYRVYDRVNKAVYLCKPLLHYRMLEQSAIHGFDVNIKDKLIPVMDELLKWMSLKGRDHIEAYYSFVAISFILVCQNGICLNKDSTFLEKKSEILGLKKEYHFRTLFNNISNVKVPFTRKIIIILGKWDLWILIVCIIYIKQWFEKRG